MIDALSTWLNSKREYYSGAALYSVYGANDQLKNLFLNGPTPYNVSKLFEELKDLYYKATIVADDTEQTTYVRSHRTARPQNVNEEDPLLIACDTKAKNLYKELMNKRAVLFNLCRSEAWEDENSPDKVKERGIIAVELLDLNYKVDKAYEDLAYVREYGTLPDQLVPVIEKYSLLPDSRVKHEIDNLRKNMNKIKNKEQTPGRIIAIKEHEESLLKLEARWALLTQAD